MLHRQMIVFSFKLFSKHLTFHSYCNRFMSIQCPLLYHYKIRPISSYRNKNMLATSRTYCTKNPAKSEEEENDINVKKPILKSLETDYVAFEDQQRIIQDVNEEMWDPLPEVEEEISEIPEYMRKRGKTGVFEISELVEILEEENGRDVCVIRIPKELDYADFMVIVTARNPKHMHALTTFVRKRFKMKDRKDTDVIPRIEGTSKSTDWLALDLSNIVLHVFTWQTREAIDLETLWTVGTQFDDLYNQPDSDIVALLKSIT